MKRRPPLSPVPGVTLHDLRPGDRVRVRISGRVGTIVRKLGAHRGWLVRWDEPAFGVEEGSVRGVNLEPLSDPPNEGSSR